MEYSRVLEEMRRQWSHLQPTNEYLDGGGKKLLHSNLSLNLCPHRLTHSTIRMERS